MKKKPFCIIVLLLFTITGNHLLASDGKPDILKKYAIQMLNTNGLTLNVEYLKKDLFSEDTIRKNAIVSFQKTGNRISFLKIFEPASQKMLLMMNDTSWIIDINSKIITCLGGRTAVKQNGLISFFPIGSLLFDTTMFSNSPFWSFSKGKDRLITTHIKIANLPSDIKDLRYEISIDSVELKVFKVIEESSFGEVGNLYQETIFSNYREFTREEAIAPDYFSTFTIYQNTPSPPQTNEDVKRHLTLNLNSLSFIDLKGDPANISQEGLIFLDLWYVGCLPCMKATPVIEKMYELYKDKIHFYSVNEMDNDMAKIIRFKNKMGVTMPVLVAKEKTISPSVGDGGYPFFVLLDAATGKVLWSYTGYTIDLEQQIRDGIQPFFNSK